MNKLLLSTEICLPVGSLREIGNNARKAESVGRMSEASSAFGSASPRTALPKTNAGGHSKRSPAEGHRPDAGNIVPGWRC